MTDAPACSGWSSSTKDLEYTDKQLDRAVAAKSQIRLVLETFRDKVFTEIYPWPVNSAASITPPASREDKK